MKTALTTFGLVPGLWGILVQGEGGVGTQRGRAVLNPLGAALPVLVASYPAAIPDLGDSDCQSSSRKPAKKWGSAPSHVQPLRLAPEQMAIRHQSGCMQLVAIDPWVVSESSPIWLHATRCT